MKLKKNYVYYGLLGNIFQYGIPISYIIWRYEIFEFEQTSITGWGALVVIISVALLRNKIKDFVQSYNDNLGVVAKKGKWAIFFITIAGILYASQFFIEGMIWLFVILGSSNLFSLIPYSAYYNKKEEYLEVKEEIRKEKIMNKAKGVSI